MLSTPLTGAEQVLFHCHSGTQFKMAPTQGGKDGKSLTVKDSRSGKSHSHSYGVEWSQGTLVNHHDFPYLRLRILVHPPSGGKSYPDQISVRKISPVITERRASQSGDPNIWFVMWTSPSLSTEIVSSKSPGWGDARSTTWTYHANLRLREWNPKTFTPSRKVSEFLVLTAILYSSSTYPNSRFGMNQRIIATASTFEGKVRRKPSELIRAISVAGDWFICHARLLACSDLLLDHVQVSFTSCILITWYVLLICFQSITMSLVLLLENPSVRGDDTL